MKPIIKSWCNYCKKDTKDRVRIQEKMGLPSYERLRCIECKKCNRVKKQETINLN